MRVSMLFLACSLAFTSAAVSAQEGNNKTLIFGGEIYSADPDNPYPEAIVIEGKKIIAVGQYKDMQKLAGSDARRVNLQGKYLMPGLIDSHAHVADGGFKTLTVEFPEGLTKAAAIKSFVEKNKNNPQRDLKGVQFYSNVSLDYWDNIQLLDSVFNAPEYQNTRIRQWCWPDRMPIPAGLIKQCCAKPAWIRRVLPMRAAVLKPTLG